MTDENLDPEVVQWLIVSGFDVLDVCRDGLRGSTDTQLMLRAATERRVIVTHDSDFGTLAILQRAPVVGILFLRPGHIDPHFTIGTLTSLLTADPDVVTPFILVARRTGDQVVIRIRSLAT